MRPAFSGENRRHPATGAAENKQKKRSEEKAPDKTTALA